MSERECELFDTIVEAGCRLRGDDGMILDHRRQ